jgi:glycosyltransferase involved in cell wall biosynthesis
MSKVINKADIYLCPVFVGGGLKLRVMDGLQQGLPALVHEVSARGYDEFEKAGVLFSYNDKQSFEESLTKIVEITKKHKIKKEDIRKLYQVNFSFEEGVKRVKKILEQNIFQSNSQLSINTHKKTEIYYAMLSKDSKRNKMSSLL